MKLKEIFCKHSWVHTVSMDAPDDYFKRCDKCDYQKPDLEMKRMSDFIEAKKAQGLSIEEIRDKGRAGHYD